jgi:hypothetical protein
VTNFLGRPADAFLDRGRGAAWTPLLLPDLLVWLDGSLITQSAGKVTAWPDLSGLGNHFVQANPALQPNYLAADVSFPTVQPAVGFNTDSNNLARVFAVAPAWWGIVAAYPATAFTDFDVLLGDSSGAFELRGDSTTANWRLASGAVAGNRFKDRVDTDVALTTANAPHLYEFVPDAPAIKTQVLGCQLGQPTRKWRGPAVMVVACSSVPSADDRNLVQAYAQSLGRLP